MSEVLYLKLNQCTEVHGKEVFLGQLGTVWCRDKAIESKCRALKERRTASLIISRRLPAALSGNGSKPRLSV